MFNQPTPPKWIYEYPPGAIKSREELRDIITEARKEKKAIRLYSVSQSGSFGILYLTSKSRLKKPKKETGLCSGDSFYSVAVIKEVTWRDRSGTAERFRRDELLCGTYSIGVNPSAEHRLFTNRTHAENYSKKLKSSKAYMQYVDAWHAYCAKMFDDFDLH